MRTIGLIGGMSWESSDIYYQEINRLVRNRLGGLHSASLLMYNFDFEEVNRHQREGRWNFASEIIMAEAFNLQRAGADCIVICSVTGHNKVDNYQGYISIPLIHIADCVNERIEGLTTVGLMGTKYTMELDYFKSKLNSQVIIPSKEDREFINHTIYDEISQGIISSKSRLRFYDIINRLEGNGAEGVILGCTEIPLIVNTDEYRIPIFNTIEIHCKAAVDFALEE